MQKDMRSCRDGINLLMETSWEVCNKIGGIYTVLSTKARVLQAKYGDRLIFIGPDVWTEENSSPYFVERKTLLKQAASKLKLPYDISIRVGRWNIPGSPQVILVKFDGVYSQLNSIFGKMWELYGVNSMNAYGDYHEGCAFAVASAIVMKSLAEHLKVEKNTVTAHFNEWTTGMGLLYLKMIMPQVATLFTTHATSIGRSICGNGKPLYDYFSGYNGDQMARELNMEAKHSIEKQTAHHVDCFTTVSEITNNECKELLDKPADVVLMNGFEDDFVPQGRTFAAKRKKARAAMLNLANKLLGLTMSDDTLIVGTSGRYEFKNKGINVYLESLNRLTRDKNLKKEVLAFINVPGWVGDPREDLVERLKSKENFTTPLECPFITHWLHNMSHDQVLDMMKYLGMSNSAESKVKVIFVPCYLDGKDGILNLEYYDLVLGNDLSVYPSYYEPWGYTPLESVAFHVPTITTDLAGFGLWVNSLKGRYSELKDGVKVIHRSDYNYSEVADVIKDTISEFSGLPENTIKTVRKNAADIAEKALWKHFIKYYYEAYDVALHNAQKRLVMNS